jgi:hypothetical protein
MVAMVARVRQRLIETMRGSGKSLSRAEELRRAILILFMSSCRRHVRPGSVPWLSCELLSMELSKDFRAIRE